MAPPCLASAPRPGAATRLTALLAPDLIGSAPPPADLGIDSALAGFGCWLTPAWLGRWPMASRTTTPLALDALLLAENQVNGDAVVIAAILSCLANGEA